MRGPIWNKARRRRAARVIHYSLATAFASFALLSMALSIAGLTGCGTGEADGEASAMASDRRADAQENRTRSAGTSAATPPASEAAAVSPRPDDTPVIVFLGTSLTAGYGLPESQAFPALIQARIEESGLDYRVINAGVSGDTSAGGLRRLGWLLRLPIAVLVLELGANDMLRGQSIPQLRSNLDTILERTSAAHPDARFVVAGMRAAPNLGPDYVDAFDSVYPDLAAKYDAAFVPFLLEDVAAKRTLNQADGIHPTAEGHVLIAKRLWPELRSVLP